MTFQDVISFCWQYDGPVPICRGNKPSTGQTQGFANAEADIGKRDTAIGAAQPTLSQFEGSDVTATPFYNNLLRAGTEATTRAYGNARSATRARANAAGFGYNNPIAQAGESEIGAAEAESQSRIPGEAALAATQPALAATGQDISAAGVYTPSSFFNTGSQAEQAGLDRRAAMWRALLAAGAGVAGAAAGKPPG